MEISSESSGVVFRENTATPVILQAFLLLWTETMKLDDADISRHASATGLNDINLQQSGV